MIVPKRSGVLALITVIGLVAAGLIFLKGQSAMADERTISKKQIESLLNDRNIRQYFHFDQPFTRGVLGIAFAEGVTADRDFEFSIDGGRIVYSEEMPSKDDDNIFVIQSVEDSGDTGLRVAFTYPMQGLVGSVTVSSLFALSDIDIRER